jgi:pantetheine-phosphate adenylyltransferase
MAKIAIYPGTFDPITFGHVDLITKGLKVVDKVIVAISSAINIDHLFSVDERMTLIKNALYKDLKINKKKVKIISFNSLTTSLCKKYKANLILRGLRAVSDFEYEFQLAGMNKKLNRNIETIFLMADIENQVISSSLVKEIAKFGGNMTKFTTKSTIRALKEKLR